MGEGSGWVGELVHGCTKAWGAEIQGRREALWAPGALGQVGGRGDRSPIRACRARKDLGLGGVGRLGGGGIVGRRCPRASHRGGQPRWATRRAHALDHLVFELSQVWGSNPKSDKSLPATYPFGAVLKSGCRRQAYGFRTIACSERRYSHLRSE